MIWLASAIGTITSPVFSRFVLMISSVNFRRIDRKSAWDLADQASSLVTPPTTNRENVVVRRRALRDSFCDTLGDPFPLMVSTGAVEFEPNGLLSCAHCPML